MRYQEGEAYDPPSPWTGESLRKQRRPLNAIVFNNLIELNKQSIIESTKPVETKLALLSAPSGISEPTMQIKELAKELKKKRSSKKTKIE
jgi:hypothetical protein